MSLEELKNAADYEKYINIQFMNLPKEETLPIPQDEVITPSNAPMRLQINLTKANLKEIISSPGLINNIVEELKKNEIDLIDFNKYFPIFKRTLVGKIKTSDQFMKDWNLFKTQKLGEQLTPIALVTTLPSSKNALIDKLNKMSTEELDAEFRKAVERTTREPFNEVNEVIYKGKGKGKIAQRIELYNKDTITSFTPAPLRFTDKKDVINQNEKKVVYIARSIDPNIDLTGMGKWTGSTSSNVETGFGLPLKKNILVATKYHSRI